MESVFGEDARKKRDSDQVEHNDEEKPKKVRIDLERRNASLLAKGSRRGKHAAGLVLSDDTGEPGESVSGDSFDESHYKEENTLTRRSKVCGLESAMLTLLQKDCPEKEFLTKEEGSAPWVTFEAGHAGDASTIAQWYRTSLCERTEKPELDVAPNPDLEADEDAKASMLEVWLAEGLGDEDSPPNIHALLARVHANSEGRVESSLGGVALLSLDWRDGERILRIEWMQMMIDPALDRTALETLEKRMWLRISALSHITSCRAISVEESLLSPQAHSRAGDNPVPKAE